MNSNKPQISNLTVQTYYYSYLNNTAYILTEYKGEMPFTHFLKSYFSQHKKFGSRDRKQIAVLCYSFFRLGKSYLQLPVKTRILLGLQLTHPNIDKGWQFLIREHELPEAPKPGDIFPWKNELSEGVNAYAFEKSFLQQPDLFLRIRPGFENDVRKKLETAGIQHIIKENVVQLLNSTKVDTIIALNKEAIIQDLSSQKIGKLLQNLDLKTPNLKYKVFDCCAASGGKSILATDVLGPLELTVADIRPSILKNLKKRFREAGLSNYKVLQSDATNKDDNIPDNYFDIIIADLPCTGSGTWARTPEQLYFFDEKKIQLYAELQQKIIDNLLRYLKPGGYFLYITCSVFKKENEDRVTFLQNKGFILVKQELISGYDNKADTMFATLLHNK